MSSFVLCKFDGNLMNIQRDSARQASERANLEMGVIILEWLMLPHCHSTARLPFSLARRRGRRCCCYCWQAAEPTFVVVLLYIFLSRQSFIFTLLSLTLFILLMRFCVTDISFTRGRKCLACGAQCHREPLTFFLFVLLPFRFLLFIFFFSIHFVVVVVVTQGLTSDAQRCIRVHLTH